MNKKSYEVTYKVGSSRRKDTVMLYGPNESEAIEALYRRCSVSRDKDIIILSID